MTEEDRFEEFLRSAAPEYHRPPADVPREAMWARIAEARRSGSPVPAARGWRLWRGRGVAVPPARVERVVLIRRWSAGLAAAVVLVASGVAIGRWSKPGTPEPAVAQGASPTPAGVRVSESPSSTPDMAYRLTVAEHLNQTEALLATFRSDVRAGRVADAQVASWARDLLTTTRLLADSRAGDDPKTKRLLEDLELVLAQMAQLDPATRHMDVELIQHAMDERSVMARLRSATPRLAYTTGT
jgi:hypothetical protein